VVWLKGNAHESLLQAIHRGRIERISAKEPQHRAFRVMGGDVHGTIRPQSKQETDAAFLAAYPIVIARQLEEP
jgi:hypothetical protein